MDACTPHARFIERLCGRIREETRRLCFIKKGVGEKSPKVKPWNSVYIRTEVCLVQPGKSLPHPISPIGFPESPWVTCTSLRFRYDIAPSSSTTETPTWDQASPVYCDGFGNKSFPQKLPNPDPTSFTATGNNRTVKQHTDLCIMWSCDNCTSFYDPTCASRVI